ncbi:MAG: glycosyltransferase family 2 protein [Gemmataceae bacterium]
MDADRPLSLSLVIPAYNEAAVIVRAVDEAAAGLGGLFEQWEVLVVDDGSTDGTGELLARLGRSVPGLRVLHHPSNRGYGAALRTGFAAARYDLVAFTDADCQFDLRDLGRLASQARTAAVVAGRRVDRQDPWRRRFLSGGYNRLVRTLLGTGVRDCDCALKVFRREALADLLPESSGFFVNAEMLHRARRLGLTVAEAPVAHRPRAGGASKVSVREVPRTLRTVFGYWWREVVRSGARQPQPVSVLTARLRVTVLPPAAAPRLSTAPARPVGPPASRQEAA